MVQPFHRCPSALWLPPEDHAGGHRHVAVRSLPRVRRTLDRMSERPKAGTNLCWPGIELGCPCLAIAEPFHTPATRQRTSQRGWWDTARLPPESDRYSGLPSPEWTLTVVLRN